MDVQRSDIRLALPSKGRMESETLAFLSDAGLSVSKPNPRQFEATIPVMPDLTVLFQRAGDIVVSVRDGSVDFGVTGMDTVLEREGENGEILIMLDALGFGGCTLNVIVPESWQEVRSMADLVQKRADLDRPLRVATKYPNVSSKFFSRYDLEDTRLIRAEGTLEVAPAIGYADLIVDLVSTGTTLRDNRLRSLDDGLVLTSQACLIANRSRLKTRPEVLAKAQQLLEFVVAHLRAAGNVSIFANIRGESPQVIAERMFEQSVIGGLQGPTISRVITRKSGDWYAVHIVVNRDDLAQVIQELRAIGGSGVVVTPVTYIFEEQPDACVALLRALEVDQ
ncbi:MAG: ATP phosphoribosyltransferase [Anaerolineales bacterium]